MSSVIPSPPTVARARKFRSHQKPSQLRFDFAGLPFNAELLKSQKSVVLEIGCGVGWHPIQLAEQRRGTAIIIAIERTENKFDSFRNRLNNHPDFQNSICAVHGDAYHFVDRFFSVARIDEVWMLYPNPEIKRPSLRWYHAPSFHRIVEAMKPGSLFHFATNLEDYAKKGHGAAPGFDFDVVSKMEISKKSNPLFQPRSHFEKKYFERGETLYSYAFRKRIT
jgi:tRNA G46 methylase TrmB